MKAAEAEVLEEIQRIFREELGHAVSPTPLQALGTDLHLDSVQLLTLVVSLENCFRVLLEEEEASAVRTVGELARFVAKRLEER